MLLKWSTFVFVAVFSFSNLAIAALTTEEKVSDFEQSVSMIKAGYGPLHYKQEIMKMNFDKVVKNYLKRVKATKTNKEFYYLMVEFIGEFNDTHFSASVPTTHAATAGFFTDLVAGKVLIDTIDRTKLSETDFPFQKGDEILAVNNEDIQSLVNRLSKRRGMGFDQSAKRYGAMAVSVRPGTSFEVPTGDVVFKIRKGTSNVVVDQKVKWIEKGQPVDENVAINVSDFSTERRRNYDDLSIEPNLSKAEREFRCSGSTRINIPSDATIIMKTPEAPFVAYYHPTPKGNVGYLRLPHYSPVNDVTKVPEPKERFAQYEYAVSELEKNTVGLIIDQDHNCGGSVSWLNNLLGLFMPGTYAPMQFTLLANKREYLEFQKWMTEEVNFTLDKVAVEKVLNKIKTAWTAGEFMTPMTSIDGIESLVPNKVRYTKPIIVLIDEMSGSGGDAFPAYMKGYNRAKLLGTRTMGAGGHVEVQAALNFSQLGSRMTKSLFYRPDGVPVENNGAVPDIPYTITREDFVNGYKDYQKFYLNKLSEML